MPQRYVVGTGVEVDLNGNALKNSPSTTVSLGVQYSWYMKVYIKSITNSDALAGMYVSDPSSGLFTNVFPIEPRLYGLTLGYNF